MSSLSLTVFLIVAFAIGVAAGVLIERLAAARRAPPAAREPESDIYFGEDYVPARRWDGTEDHPGDIERQGAAAVMRDNRVYTTEGRGLSSGRRPA